MYVGVDYSGKGGAEVKLEPEKLSGLEPTSLHPTQSFHPPTALKSLKLFENIHLGIFSKRGECLRKFTWEYGSDLRLELASIRKSDAFSMAAKDFGISDFIFKSCEELIVSRPTLKIQCVC